MTDTPPNPGDFGRRANPPVLIVPKTASEALRPEQGTAIIVFSVLIAFEGVAVPGSVKIDTVAEGSPAQQADIQPGDILVSINGEEVTEIEAGHCHHSRKSR